MSAVQISEYAYMKNGHSAYSSANGGTEFWNNTYKPYIRTITFGNDLSNLPIECTEENLCWDVSHNSSQNKKVYGYLVDSGLVIEETDTSTSTTTTKPLYNLYIVSEAPIFAPQDCSLFFAGFNSLVNINYNNNFNTSKVTNMSAMFMPAVPGDWGSIVTLTVNNKNVKPSFIDRKNDGEIEMMISGDGGDEVGFYSVIEKLDLSNFNTSNVKNMSSMFWNSKATILDVSNFDTSNVKNMNSMFKNATNLKTIYGSSKFVTTAVTSSTGMFSRCTNLVGGAGTKYDSTKTDKTYARIDGGTSNPGYFTAK